MAAGRPSCQEDYADVLKVIEEENIIFIGSHGSLQDSGS